MNPQQASGDSYHKQVNEDWTFFNLMARRRADESIRTAGAGAAPPFPAPALPALRPVPPIQPPVPVLRPVPPVPPVPPRPPVHGWWEHWSGVPFGIGGWLLGLGGLLFCLWAIGHLPTDPARTYTALTTPEATTPEVVVTNYTTFNSIDFRGGRVVTGWNFNRSGDTEPSSQFCYYSVHPAGFKGGKMDYAVEDRPGSGRNPMPPTLADSLGEAGWGEAATKCRWH